MHIQRLCVFVCFNSLVTVVVEAVVAAQRSQGAQSDGVGEKNLSASINPHLSQRIIKATFHNLSTAVSSVLL